METARMMSLLFLALKIIGSLKNPYLLRFLPSAFEIFLPEKIATELDPLGNYLKVLSKIVVVKTFVKKQRKYN